VEYGERSINAIMSLEIQVPKKNPKTIGFPQRNDQFGMIVRSTTKINKQRKKETKKQKRKRKPLFERIENHAYIPASKLT
jgi:hypothetical protein